MWRIALSSRSLPKFRCTGALPFLAMSPTAASALGCSGDLIRDVAVGQVI